MSLLEIDNLHIELETKYGKEEIVRGLSMHVNEGEIFGLLGASGAGKSMSMRAVLGLLPDGARKSAGSILFEGRQAVPEELRGRKIAMVLQDPMTALDPVWKVGTQITETIRAHEKCSRREALRQAEALLVRCHLPNPKRVMKQYPRQLSGGMRQRVVIAIALACKPKLLIADEPTTSLDVTIQAKILELLKELVQSEGMAMVLISHDPAVVHTLCDRVQVLQEGRLTEMADSRTENTWAAGEAPAERTEAEVLLELCHVNKNFPQGADAVKDVSFRLERGSIYGLVGESGCGKSTLARMIVGALMPDSGEIYYEGCRIDHLKGRERSGFYRKIQMIFQDPYASLNPKMTAGQILEDPLIVNHMYNRKMRRQKAEEMLEAVGLCAADAKKYPREFSGGQRQRIGIGRALIVNPELLICDEPVSALDIDTQTQILVLLQQVQRKRGLTCLFIAHDLGAVRQLSQHIGVMYQGELVESGTVSDVYQNPEHSYTKALLKVVPGYSHAENKGSGFYE